MFSFNGLSIRPIREGDKDFLLLLRSDPDVWKNLGDINMLTEEKQLQWIKKINLESGSKYFIILDGEASIGLIRADQIDYVNNSVRVGLDIERLHRGKGFGERSFGLLLKYCFDFLNMNRVWLCVIDFNERARKLYTKLSFKEEGKYRQAIFRDGEYHDYIIMSILREEYRANNEISL